MRKAVLLLCLTILLCLATPLLPGQVKITKGTDRITVDVDQKPFTTLYLGPDAPKPYLHPLRSASGKQITRSFPMEKVEGEPTDHPHHRGLWFTHGEVNGINFWENEASYKTKNRGKIRLKSIDEANSGDKSGVIAATFEWLDPDGKLMLTEKRAFTFYAQPEEMRMFDVDITLTPAMKLNFADTKEGTFAIRLTPELDEKHSGQMVNAEGQTTMKNVWGKKSNWVDYAGEVKGEKLGIAIFDHPANPAHPTRWHSRDYGLFAANPFGYKDFTGDKSTEGGMTAEANQPLRFRYRVVIHPGNAQTAHIAELYQQYGK